MERVSYHIKQWLVLVILLCISPSVFAFAEDLCFQQIHYLNKQSVSVINCLPLPEKCQSDQLSYQDLLMCKARSFANVLATPLRDDRVIGHRSLLHLDATDYLAQMIGFTPEDAYQIAIYDQAADNGMYIPFDQSGHAILSDEVIARCKVNMNDNDQCLLMTPSIKGLMRDDFKTSGIFLHVSARSANKSTPPSQYPFDYLTTPALEKTLINLKNWVYGVQPAFCVGGLTDSHGGCITSTASSPAYLTGYLPFLMPNRMQYFELNTPLGDFIINYETDVNDAMIPGSIVYSRDIDTYVKPQKGTNAKLGIFLHLLQDRYSHQKCNDVSYYTNDAISPANYMVYYDPKTCDQGSHMLWHGWEVGVNQNNMVDPKNTTLKPALYATYDQLLEYAKTHGMIIRQDLNRETVVSDVLACLEIRDADVRLQAMVALFEDHGLQPLPMHGVNNKFPAG